MIRPLNATDSGNSSGSILWIIILNGTKANFTIERIVIMEIDYECKMILFYLKDRGSITAREAYALCGCKKLYDRINDLQKIGIRIKRETKTHRNTAGNKVRYTTYILEA
jgi:hypothetical protein